MLSPVAVEAALEWQGLAGTRMDILNAVSIHGLTGLFPLHFNLPGALTVPMCLAVATGLWVWILPETRGIELPKLLEATSLPTTMTTAGVALPSEDGVDGVQKKQE